MFPSDKKIEIKLNEEKSMQYKTKYVFVTVSRYVNVHKNIYKKNVMT